MGSLVFLPEGWDDYLYWQDQDKKNVAQDKPAVTRYLKMWQLWNRKTGTIAWK